ncbi:hypothetical protein [Marinobacter xiaoshiensis]|uniref:Uncharacterized protein n=1 Tax=Marinobacter xiaoshiensis TaxID=3073652 RepID=A0ABU2HEX5_9GAMM|nr:hypothetical protein [Marinobacter sp. F60267]MDS1309121.1 hypothetical protein [Marinobacter sp. F60267]
MATQRFRYSAGIIKNGIPIIIAGLVLAFLATAFVVLNLPNPSELDLTQLYLDAEGEVDIEVQLFGLVLGVVCIAMLANRRVRLILNNESLAIHIPKLTGLGFMGLTTGTHRIPLGAIESVELTPVTGIRNIGQAIQQSRLSIVTREKTYCLQPYNFLIEGGPDHRMGFGSVFGKSRTKVEALLIEAPLVQALSLATKGVSFTSTPAESTGPLAGHFNLMQHKGMVIQMALLAGLGAYALVDYLMLTNYLVVGDMPIWPFVAGGLLAGALGIRLGKGAPRAEHLGLAILLGLITAAAIYPGLQRYTLIASQAPVEITYQMTESGYFEHASFPDIDQRKSGIFEYWASLPLGENYRFSLYEPVAGFVMVDMAPVYAKSRAFYEASGQ